MGSYFISLLIKKWLDIIAWVLFHNNIYEFKVYCAKPVLLYSTHAFVTQHHWWILIVIFQVRILF